MKLNPVKAPAKPGIYQFFNDKKELLYVGKARNLKKRVSSYFRKNLSAKTERLMQLATSVELTVTHSENEALLLESNLIKQYKPKFNILLRDDKSYPYLYLTTQQKFPRLDFYRGSKKKQGQYFGPFPSVTALRETLTLVQKLFKIRQCSDSFFEHRARPCLQYQIKRCTAPCVDLVTQDNYQQQVKHAVLFLQGKNNDIIEQLIRQMDESAENLQYEKAASYRDQIAKIRQVQAKQVVDIGNGNFDVITTLVKNNIACVQVITIRNGQMLGSKSYFPKISIEIDEAEVLEAFIPQYYNNPLRRESVPQRIIISISLENADWIAQALSEQFEKRIQIIHGTRGRYRRWQQMAKNNAEHAYLTFSSSQQHIFQRLTALQKTLGLANRPLRIECFDISHTQGSQTVASCVVFTEEGASNADYRRFNIKDITPGDDYAAMKQVLTRRYQGLKERDAPIPDVILIDGGKGQLKQAEDVLEELQISGVMLLAISKGEGRKPIFDQVHLSGRVQPLALPVNSEAKHFLQQIRDEAHRFAISGHRKKRQQASTQSLLDAIPGIGSKRRRELLHQFGGLQGLMKASREDLARAPGIGPKLAKEIFDCLHH